MSGRRFNRVLYVICGVAGLFVTVGIVSMFVLGSGTMFGEAFVGGFAWAFSPEHAALKGAGCIHAMKISRPRASAMRASGASEEQISRVCEADGRCGYEAVLCTALEKNVVPCEIVASLHKRYAKPDRRFTVKTSAMPRMDVVCEAVYDADGTLAIDLHERRKPKKARADD